MVSQTSLLQKYRLIGQSELFLDMLDLISRYATIDRPVLILGERGTGKELVAARLHYLSDRWQGPRITLNCAAFAPELLTTELFGHEKGAFTGATERRAGKFELSRDGTLLLDEIGNSPQNLQQQVLRVIEYGEYHRVGGSTPVQTNARIIAATNEDLYQLGRDRQFRMDLLDRLSFAIIRIPPLRDRKEDIPLLAHTFAQNMLAEMKIDGLVEFSEAVMAQLVDHNWPGNIRELKNTIEHTVFMQGATTIDHIALPPSDLPQTPPSVINTTPVESTPTPEVQLPCDFQQQIQSLQQTLINQALQQTQFNQKQAAALLNLTYDQFRGYVRKFGK